MSKHPATRKRYWMAAMDPCGKFVGFVIEDLSWDDHCKIPSQVKRELKVKIMSQGLVPIGQMVVEHD